MHSQLLTFDVAVVVAEVERFVTVVLSHVIGKAIVAVEVVVYEKLLSVVAFPTVSVAVSVASTGGDTAFQDVSAPFELCVEQPFQPFVFSNFVYKRNNHTSSCCFSLGYTYNQDIFQHATSSPLQQGYSNNLFQQVLKLSTFFPILWKLLDWI